MSAPTVEPLAVPDPATTRWVPVGPVTGNVPSPVVNGQWVKGVGGAAVWSAIGHDDVTNGINTIDGNQWRPQWSSAHGLQFYIDNTDVSTNVSGAMTWGTILTYNTGMVTHNTDFTVAINHNAGRPFDAIIVWIEDVWYSRNFSWSSGSNGNNSVTIFVSAVGAQGDGNAQGWLHVVLGFKNP